MEQVQVRNSSFSDKFYYSVIVRTCFQKDNYDSLIRFFLLCSYSDLYIGNQDQEYNLPVHPKIFELMIGYPILIKAIERFCLFSILNYCIYSDLDT